MFLAPVVLQTVDALPGVKARVRSRHVSFLFLFSIAITHTVTRCAAVVWTCWVVALLVKLSVASARSTFYFVMLLLSCLYSGELW